MPILGGMGVDGASSTRDRSRRVLLGVLSSVVVVVVALVVASVTGVRPTELATAGTDVDAVAAIDEPPHGPAGSSATTIEPGSTTTTSAVSGDPVDETTTSTTSPDTLPPTTTTTVCADSFDAACGDFSWTRPPGPNQPMTASIELLTENPVVGEPIYFRLRASDPDATPLPIGSLSLRHVGEPWGDEICYPHGADEGFGPWTPPAPRPGSTDEDTWRLVREPGTYWIYGCFSSISWEPHAPFGGAASATQWCPGDGVTVAFEGWRCTDPYGDFVTPHVEIVVAPPES
jgi:hypothetical protein